MCSRIPAQPWLLCEGLYVSSFGDSKENNGVGLLKHNLIHSCRYLINLINHI